MKNHDRNPSDAEREKLRTMRRATSAHSTKFSISGVEKRGGPRAKPVSLPNADTLRKLDDGAREEE
jgi:hypothetical protein